MCIRLSDLINVYLIHIFDIIKLDKQLLIIYKSQNNLIFKFE